jgi:hypothetical protein
MGCNWQISWVVLCTCVLVGCNSSSRTEPAAPAVPSDPAARSAYEFFDAVLKGDTERASRQLTPLAIERIAARGEQFAPPGDDGTVSFRIGQVVRPNPSDALVECVLREAGANQRQQDTQVYCLLRLVDGQWRVSGIAHTFGPDHTPMILDFETGQHAAVPPAAAGQGPPHVAARPSPAAGGEIPDSTRR